MNEIVIDSSANRSLRVVVVSSSGFDYFLPYIESDDIDLVGVMDMSLPKPREGGLSGSEKIVCFLRRLKRLRSDWKAKRKLCNRDCRYYKYNQYQFDELERRLHEMEPDVVIVYKMPIFKSHILSIPKIGIINIHPSLLPKYRGGSPILWMSKNFDLKGGVTVHMMDIKEDTGPILAQQEFDIASGMSETEILNRAIHEHGIPLSLNVVRDLAQGRCSPLVQKGGSPTEYAYNKKPDQIWHLIDWEAWGLEHTWHMLRCRPFWKDRLPPHKGWRSWVEWEIGNYVQAFNDNGPGQVLSVAGGYAISHKEGWIKIKPVIRPSQIIRRMLKVFS